MKVVPLRLQPGDDLRQGLEAWMGEQEEQAGCVISAVGSLSVAQLRGPGWPSMAATTSPPFLPADRRAQSHAGANSC